MLRSMGPHPWQADVNRLRRENQRLRDLIGDGDGPGGGLPNEWGTSWLLYGDGTTPQVFRSEDGAAWTSQPTVQPRPSAVYWVFWNPLTERWVARSASDGTLWETADGGSYQQIVTGGPWPGAAGGQVEYVADLGLFIAGGVAGNQVLWSEDCQAWTTASYTGSWPSGSAFRFGWDGTWIAGFRGHTTCYKSADGKLWQPMGMAANPQGFGAFVGGYWLASAGLGASQTSLTTATWTVHAGALPSDAFITAVGHDRRGFAVVGTNRGGIYTTGDGMAFVQRKPPTGNTADQVHLVRRVPTGWLAAGGNGAAWQAGPDGEVWTPSVASSTSAFRAAAGTASLLRPPLVA
jgi:hypothetical protein